MIDQSRRSSILSDFFKEAFAGILSTAIWSADNAVVCTDRQTCRCHLRRELKKVDATEITSWPPDADLYHLR